LECGSEAAAFIQHDEKLMISPSFAIPDLLNPKRKLCLRTPKPLRAQKVCSIGRDGGTPAKNRFVLKIPG